jgi:hypothetical protein
MAKPTAGGIGAAAGVAFGAAKPAGGFGATAATCGFGVPTAGGFGATALAAGGFGVATGTELP